MTSRGISILAAFALSAAAQTAGGDANLRNRVVDLFQSDRYQEALTEALRLVQVTKSQYRQSPASTGARVAYADALGLEGTVYGAMGNVEQASRLLLTAASVLEKLECNTSPETPRTTLRTCVRLVTQNKVNLAVLQRDHARVDATTDSLITEVVDYRARMLGPYDHDTMNAVHLRGTILNAMGDFRSAEILFKTVLEHVSPNDDKLYSDTIDALGRAYVNEGQPERALGLLRQALRDELSATHSESLSLAAGYNNLGGLALDMGNYEEAQKNHKLALDIRERLHAPDYLIARSLNNLALDAYHLNEPEVEERFLRESLAKLAAYPPTHPDVMRANQNMVPVLRRQGQLREARQLGESLLAIYTQRRGTGQINPVEGSVLNSLSLIAEDEGKLAEALDFDRRAIALWSTVSEIHPEVTRNQINAGRVAWRLGDLHTALDYFKRVSDAEAVRMNTVLLVGSEQEKQKFRNTFIGLDLAVSFHAQNPRVDGALRMAFEDVLRQKGVVLDAMTDQKERLRRMGSGDIIKRLAELNGRLSRCAVLAAGGPDSAQLKLCRDEYAKLATEQETLQRQFAERLPEGRSTFRPLKLEHVQGQLKGHALVEFFLYFPQKPEYADSKEGKEEPLYIAYVLPPSGPAQYVPLGTERAVLKLVLKFRDAIWAGRSGPYDARPARELDKAIMQPVRALLGGVRQVYIAPDGALNVIPFAALVSEDGRELIETYRITYLTSGRDLMRWSSLPRTPGRGDHLFAKVAYGPIQTGAKVPQGACAEAYAPLYPATRFDPEPAQLLTTMQLHKEWAASEEALKDIVSPRILHIFTHGFFCMDPTVSREARQGAGRQDDPTAALKDPLLRSGLVLAAVNLGGLANAQKFELAKAEKDRNRNLLEQKARGDDGFLTAREAADLRLDGTELVVLNACETGLGQVSNGEGVFGLRRAFLLAGARSQVTTLWRIKDESELITTFYKNLKNMNRSEALRAAQLHMREQYRHPYFWAGFTFSGDERPIALGN